MAEVAVHVEIGGETVRAGRLFGHRRGKIERASFAYDAAYLARSGAYALDPALPLMGGQHQSPLGRSLFGALSDSCPDRWGRLLIQRQERRRAEAAGETPRSLSDFEVLLGIRDGLRQGAIRFADEHGGWLARGDDAIPYLLDLPQLLGASDAIERDDPEAEQLRTLVRAGSSLGGARPKANVLDDDGALVIAKFPRGPDLDEWDVVRWEGVALELARRAGIRTAASRVVPVDGRGVLLVRRFDRIGDRRLGYASAMTMLELADGDRATYVEIGEVLEQEGSAAEEDLRELWRRIVFGVLIRNTDDHLRNHAFLRDDAASGWRLSPAFDVNPNPAAGNGALATSIVDTTDEARLEVALEVAPLFRVRTEQAARVIVGEVIVAVDQWRQVAASFGCTPADVRRMAAAFEHRDAEAARALL